MLASPCYVIADTHIGFAPPAVTRAVLAFLRGRLAAARAGQPGSLLINGDLFEFWFEWRSVIPRPAFRILSALADLREAGADIVWIAGNHDCWGGEVLRNDVGLTYHVGPWEGDLAGWRARVEHGDGLRKVEDRRYRLLRAVLRNGFAVRAFRWFPPDFASRLASGGSDVSRHAGQRDGGAGLRRIALDHLNAPRPPELVIFGHSHVRALERAPGGGVYANPGSWLEQPTFLRITPDRIEVREWDGSPEGQRLDALDRRPQESAAPV